jgi:iron complex outermembrane receptor protein
VQDGFTFTQPTRFGDEQDAGQVGLSWRPLRALRLFARADRNFRYAKVDEFTFTDADAGSNENALENQTGETLEAGAAWTGAGLDLSGTLFRLDAENEIAFDPTGGDFGFGANVNLPRTRRDGALLHARWQALDGLALSLGGQYVDAEVTRGAGLVGRDIPMVARKIGRADATVSLPHGFSAQVGVGYTGRRAYAGDFDNSLPPQPSHAVAHLALGCTWRSLTVDVRVNNLLDREYSEYGASSLDPNTFAEQPASLPSPERNASLRLHWEL